MKVNAKLDSRHYNHKELRALRLVKDISLVQLSSDLKVERKRIWRAERGECATYDFLCRLAEYYDRPVTYFLYPHPKVA
jgi:transcriptional regulator with XRE-family HTH domain